MHPAALMVAALLVQSTPAKPAAPAAPPRGAPPANTPGKLPTVTTTTSPRGVPTAPPASAPASTPAGAPAAAPGTPPAPAGSPAAASSTISGRPPQWPLQRVTPRLWDLKFEGSIWVPGLQQGDTMPMQLQATTVWLPLVMQSTFSMDDPSSVKCEQWLEGRKDPHAQERVQYKQGLAFGLSAVGIPFGEVAGQSLKWVVTWRAQCWSSKIDEAAAARITWPAEWPAEVQEALQPQPGIESDAPEFKAFVDKVSQGKLRSVTPWIATKELVRATINAFRAVDNDGLRVESGFTRGLVLSGALASMRTGSGSIHDVCAACVATLRAAGIPSRVVIGLADLPTSSGNATRARLVTWCEFYLPTAGWVPFSPSDLRGALRGGLSLDRPWPEFGTWDELNERIPVSYTWIAPVPGSTSMPYPAVWSWTTHGGVMNTQIISDMVGVQIIGRGRAKE